MLKKLTIPRLKTEATAFAAQESTHAEPSLFGVTDGKAVGTYLEQKFQANLHKKYDYVEGSSAKGIDFPKLDVDIKVTSIPPKIGYLTISNALQWRLQYSRVIQQAGTVVGIEKL